MAKSKWNSAHQARHREVRPLAVRFWEKVDRSGGPDACWPWMAYRTKHGYGMIGLGGKGNPERSHRVAWLLTHGPIPEGELIRHSCDNPPCCNPAHLSPGTPGDNMADRDAAGRQARGESAGRVKLTEFDVREIRAQRAAGATAPSLASRYGVAIVTIYSIQYRKSWRHIE